MKCQYAHCCFNDQINYNWRRCSSTRQSSHQSVTRDDMADIIAHLALIASTHCMNWFPSNDAISLGTLYLAEQEFKLPNFTSFEVDREIVNYFSYFRKKSKRNKHCRK